MANIIANTIKKFFNRNKTVIVELCDGAYTPVYATVGSAGADLFSRQNITIPARGKALISTGLRMRMPNGIYGRISSRSGLSAKFSLETGAGTVDCDYTGLVGVILYNHSDKEYEVQKGDRIAQIVFLKYEKMKFVHGIVDEALTKRASGGFGSTGR